MEKHTPTPWKVQTNKDRLPAIPHYWNIRNHENLLVAECNIGMSGVEANAELIVKAVNAHQSLVDLLTDSYLALQIASNKNMTTAVNTDSLRASLRNKLSDLIGIDGQELQETIEKKAILSNTLNQTL